MLKHKTEAESNGKHGVLYMGPFARIDFNITLCRLQHMYMGNPMPESTLTLCQSQP
jgi:hypothetical protein